MKTKIYLTFLILVLGLSSCKKGKSGMLFFLPPGEGEPAYLPPTSSSSGNNNSSVEGTEVPANPGQNEEFPNPTYVIATGGNQQITIQWVNHPDALETEICYGTGALGFPCDGVGQNFTSTTANNFLLAGLNDNETRYFLLRHKYSGGYSSGVTVNATTLSFPDPISVQVQSLSVFGSPKVIVSWVNFSGSNSPDGHILLRGTDGVTFPTIVSQGDTTITSFTDTSVSYGNTYYYKVKHNYSIHTRESTGVVVSITPQPVTVNPITGLTATASNGQILLGWNPPGAGFTVKVFRCAQPSCNSTNPTNATAGVVEVCTTLPTNPSSCLDSGLTNGQSHSYAVYAVDPQGNTSTPTHITSIPFQALPVSASIAPRLRKNQIAFTSVPSLTNRIEVYYSINGVADSKRPGDGGNGLELRPSPSNWWAPSPTVFHHNSLTEGVTYYYSIYAVYSNGTGWTYSTPTHVQAQPYYSGVIITQSSSIAPANTQIPNTYNWDQTIQFQAASSIPADAKIRCEITNSTATPPDPTSSSPECVTLYLTNGQTRNIKAAVVDPEGNVADISSALYIINYNAYVNNWKLEAYSKTTLTLMTHEAGNTSYSGFSSDLVAKLTYQPGSGETYSIEKGTDTNINASAKTANTDADLPAPASVNSSTLTPTAYNTEEDRIGPTASTTTALNLSSDLNTSTLNGKSYSGGRSKKFKVLLKIVNGGQFLIDKNFYVVYPKLNLASMDMWNRPKITPYLWTKYEPVVQVDVTKTSYFTGTTTPANGAKVYFRVQYAQKDNPYGNTDRNITWSTTYPSSGTLKCGGSHPAWADPDYSECAAFQSTTGEPLTIIDTEPYTSANRFTGNSGSPFTKTIPAVNGRAYYQIDNPYDTFKIGEAGHYSYVGTVTINGKTVYDGIDETNKRGQLHSKAFRTLVRFRVRARGETYRDANNILRSFESDEVASFNATKTTKIWNINNESYTSDMPVGFRGFPIEVAERYEGYGTRNHLYGLPWYQKHGFTWLGSNQSGSENFASDSIHKHFDTSKTKIVIYSHGWQKNGFYELFIHRAGSFKTDGTGGVNHYTNATDLSSWQTTHGVDVNAREWMANNWLTQGYNVGIFHWNKWAQEDSMHPYNAERKIWAPTGNKKMAFYHEQVGDDRNYADRLADPIRSASVGMMLAQEFLDSLPDGYTPTEIIFGGHSLGNQVVTNATKKLIDANNAGLIPANRLPSRVDLLDPYWGDPGWADGYESYYPAETARAYADTIHSKGIPIQWYKSSALTQLPGGDSNQDMYKKTNYVKLTLSTCDNGYVTGGPWMACRNNGEQHGEAVVWFYRSIVRNQDVTGSWCSVSFGSTCSSTSRTVSAATPKSALLSRLNQANFRDGSAWSWFDVGNGGTWNKTLSTTDDQFIHRNSCCGNGGGNPGM